MLPVLGHGLSLNLKIYANLEMDDQGVYDEVLDEENGIDNAIINEPHVKGLFLSAYILVFLFCVFGKLMIDI